MPDKAAYKKDLFCLIKKIYYFFYMHWCFTYIYVYVRVLDTLELKLYIVVSCHVGF